MKPTRLTDILADEILLLQNEITVLHFLCRQIKFYGSMYLGCQHPVVVAAGNPEQFTGYLQTIRSQCIVMSLQDTCKYLPAKRLPEVPYQGCLP